MLLPTVACRRMGIRRKMNFTRYRFCWEPTSWMLFLRRSKEKSRGRRSTCSQFLKPHRKVRTGLKMLHIHVLVYHLLDRHLTGRQVLALKGCEWEVVRRCNRAKDRKFAIRKLMVPKDHSQKIGNESRRSLNLLNASPRQGFRMLLMDCVNAPDNLSGSLQRNRNECSRKNVSGRNQRCGKDRHRHVRYHSVSWNRGEKESNLNLAITPLLRCANCTSRWNTSVATYTGSVSK